MNLRKALALGASLVTAATMLMAAPAHAVDHSGDTTVTFTLNNGSLSLLVSGSSAGTAATASLGSLTPDGVTSQVSGDLLSTTITDSRNSLAGYTVSATCDDFVSGGNTIAKANATVSIPTASVSGALGGSALTGSNLSSFFVPTAGVACGAAVPTIAARATILSSLLTTLGVVSANNTITYTPHIAITVPAGTPNGTYSSIMYQTAV